MHNFKDEYLSVEHLIMALFELNSSWLKEILNGYNLNKKNVKKIISSSRPITGSSFQSATSFVKSRPYFSNTSYWFSGF